MTQALQKIQTYQELRNRYNKTGNMAEYKRDMQYTKQHLLLSLFTSSHKIVTLQDMEANFNQYGFQMPAGTLSNLVRTNKIMKVDKDKYCLYSEYALLLKNKYSLQNMLTYNEKINDNVSKIDKMLNNNINEINKMIDKMK